MKIDHGQISMASAHRRESYTETKESLRYFERSPDGERNVEYQRQSRSSGVEIGMQAVLGDVEAGRLPQFPGQSGRGLGLGLQIANPPGQEQFNNQSPVVDEVDVVDEGGDFPDSIEELKLSVFVHMMEQMFGAKFQLLDKDEMLRIDENAQEMNEIADKMESVVSQGHPEREQPQHGWRMEYHASQSYHEEEYTTFSAQGKVVTGDGREIDLNLELGLSRAFQSETVISAVAGTLKDPLVINFDAPSVGLDDNQTFRFDIDADGTVEDLAQLTSGSGFLALDRNGDGIINDGTELFGAQSGNGFADLRELDEDGDGFIDEDDSVFSQLRIWTPGEDGSGELYALLDKDVGAIYLGNTDTKFQLNRASDNENLGVLRSSGVFLKESGGVGTVQQIDLKV
ncbi:hypothetical protein [Oceanospirillum sediminis]|uniref:EF-hand domain-containing protein n=1 Tax=Oceanospirillum sediminis TaxID=2760088 RepID=A0A839ISZ9_9GAMM|nr:hypothetical protein [Oceanospirillum sediminis]MBB1487732.1 hypothetical protein [Oceanospirillum sediminis]